MGFAMAMEGDCPVFLRRGAEMDPLSEETGRLVQMGAWIIVSPINGIEVETGLSLMSPGV